MSVKHKKKILTDLSVKELTKLRELSDRCRKYSKLKHQSEEAMLDWKLAFTQYKRYLDFLWEDRVETYGLEVQKRRVGTLW